MQPLLTPVMQITLPPDFPPISLSPFSIMLYLYSFPSPLLLPFCLFLALIISLLSELSLIFCTLSPFINPLVLSSLIFFLPYVFSSPVLSYTPNSPPQPFSSFNHGNQINGNWDLKEYTWWRNNARNKLRKVTKTKHLLLYWVK